MSYPVRIYTKAYAPSPDTDNYSIQVDKTIWEEATQQEGSKRKFLRIEHPDGFQDCIAPLGQPILNDVGEDHHNIYLPLWMADSWTIKGEGEEAVLEVLDEAYFPEATKIVLRVIDSAFYNADIKDELEKALSAMGVIQQHTTLQIPIEAMGGYRIEVFVSQTEPANIVLCDGEEVVVDFEEPVDQITPPPPEPVRIPTPPPTPVPLFPTTFSNASSQGFQAFQGQGQTLGGSNVQIPEWRRGLPPPKRK